MGWWWNSTQEKGTSTKQQLLATEVPSQDLASEQLADSSILEAKHNMTREEQSNHELITFLKELQSQTEREEKKAYEDKLRSKTPSTSSFASTSTDDISPDSLYPTEIHCRSAFDYAFFCQSFGGQFVNVYRYGGFRSCSNHWQDFWLCMKTRNWKEKDRAKTIQDHYKKKAIKYKTGPSSEDVWEVRVEPIKDAFQGNLEALEAKIEEWKKANPDTNNPWLKTT
jgi:Protein of unknown function (DUF3128)